MAFPPTPAKVWAAGLLPNQRIVFSSLLTTMGTYVSGIGNQVIARGFTCSGSSNGTTGAMDGTNRCTSASGFAVRAANTVTAQSWIVWRAANGAQTLVAYVGASDDIARVSFSPGGLFAAAGTPTFTPTATDEIVISTGVSLIGATASNDRVFTVWVDSTSNMWRAAIFRQGVLAGPLLGVELFDATPLVGVTCSPAVWGFCYGAANTATTSARESAFSANASGGICRTSGNTQTQMGAGVLLVNGSINSLDGVLLTANGTVYACRSTSLWSSSAGCVGEVGNRFDWYDLADISPCGGLTVGLSWVLLNNQSGTSTGGFLWPWDGSTATCVTS